MPGIVGLVTNMPREWAEEQLSRMVAALHHESFYRTGTWINEAAGVYVGWVVKKGSFCDGMPLSNERGDVTLVFSGEEFPGPGTPACLKARGHEVEVDGPSYLVHLYEEDSAFPAGLNGRFQGILVDRRRGTAMLFNDRYGMGRVYYHECKGAFYFAAEAKAILAVRPELRRVDVKGLGEFISCGCVFQNRTLFNDIQVLPPASAWVFREASLTRRATYFQPEEWERQEPLEPEEYYQQLKDVFTRNLPRYFNGGERIGMSLTGGLDTRMIMAWENVPPSDLRCYSFGSEFRDCQDVTVARRVAQARGQSHEVIPVGSDFLSRFSHYAERAIYFTDGCVEVSRAADLYVNERVRAIAPVRMTGNYGGEVLRQVRAFKPTVPLGGLFQPELLLAIGQATQTYNDLVQGHPLSFAVFRQAPWHHYGLLALEETQLSLRTPFLDNALVQLVFRAPRSAVLDNEVCLRLIADGDASLMGIPTDRGLAGTQSRLVSALARSLLDFTFKAEYAYDYGMPQWVARIDHLLSPFRPERLFLGRHKFAHYRVWYRDQLASYVREILLDPRTLSRPYLERSRVEKIVEGHLRLGHNYTSAVHKLLSLELLHRLLLDTEQPC